jgi:hypothetical protein
MLDVAVIEHRWLLNDFVAGVVLLWLLLGGFDCNLSWFLTVSTSNWLFLRHKKSQFLGRQLAL